MNRKLNGKIIPPCMIGTWAWGKGMNGSKMIFGKTYSEAQLIETFRIAYDLGFTLWDTAEVYGMGNSEKILGRCIVGKKDVIISTKHMPKKKYKKGVLTDSLNGSIDRIGVKSIDLYWLHQPYALLENTDEMISCMKSGKVKNVGLSNCNIVQIKEVKNILESNGLRLAAVQNHFSLLSVDRQEEVVKYCNENNIIFFGYMVLEQGALSGYYGVKNPFPTFSLRGILFSKRKFGKIQPLIDYERELAEKYNVDISQIPIVWAISKRIVPIVGLTKPQHAKTLAEGIKVELLPEEIKELELLAEKSGVRCKGNWE